MFRGGVNSDTPQKRMAHRHSNQGLIVRRLIQVRWKFARELLVVAERSEKRRDLSAHRQLRQVLRNVSLFHEE